MACNGYTAHPLRLGDETSDSDTATAMEPDTAVPMDTESSSESESSAPDTAPDDVDDTLADTTPEPLPRIVAVANLHGDLNAARRALTTAQVLDENDQWIGDDTIVVQLGDILDYGTEELALIDFMLSVRQAAQAAGGDVVLLWGNHEFMAVQGNFRYLTEANCAAYRDYPLLDTDQAPLAELSDPDCRMRGAALLPGGPVARLLATFPAALVLGDLVFVHGGILSAHLEQPLSAHNAEIAAWARGELAAPHAAVHDMLWDRTYSDNKVAALSDEVCDELQAVLDSIGARTMVVAHSRFEHINAACHGAVWRIDTGLAAYFSGHMEVLEIDNGTFSVLYAP